MDLKMYTLENTKMYAYASSASARLADAPGPYGELNALAIAV
jgi:hypothetical protein